MWGKGDCQEKGNGGRKWKSASCTFCRLYSLPCFANLIINDPQRDIPVDGMNKSHSAGAVDGGRPVEIGEQICFVYYFCNVFVINIAVYCRNLHHTDNGQTAGWLVKGARDDAT